MRLGRENKKTVRERDEDQRRNSDIQGENRGCLPVCCPMRRQADTAVRFIRQLAVAMGVKQGNGGTCQY
jgi:hypothetical protein